jgi:hypothetical protein
MYSRLEEIAYSLKSVHTTLGLGTGLIVCVPLKERKGLANVLSLSCFSEHTYSRGATANSHREDRDQLSYNLPAETIRSILFQTVNVSLSDFCMD